MKCVMCNKKSEYIKNGTSVCKEHLRFSMVERAFLNIK